MPRYFFDFQHRSTDHRDADGKDSPYAGAAPEPVHNAPIEIVRGPRAVTRAPLTAQVRDASRRASERIDLPIDTAELLPTI